MSTLRPTIEAQPIDIIGTRIVVLRGQKVMIDADLAELYGVPTKRLNEQVSAIMSAFRRISYSS